MAKKIVKKKTHKTHSTRLESATTLQTVESSSALSDSKRKDLTDAYSSLRPRLELIVSKVTPLLKELVHQHGIKYYSIDGRVKTLDSFLDKCQRPTKEYDDPITEIKDLAGLRIVLYYADDVDRVCDILNKSVSVDETVDKRTALAHDQFGYLSVHKIATITDDRSALPEWAPLDGIAFEIQVRTILQHAWAVLSHSMEYKREADVPLTLRRQLTRLAGLMELADEQFVALRTGRQDWERTVRQRMTEEDADIAIDIVSLKQYIKASPTIHELLRIAREGEVKAITLDAATETSRMSSIVEICNRANITSVAQFDSIMKAVARSSVLEKIRGRIFSDLGTVRVALVAALPSSVAIPDTIMSPRLVRSMREAWRSSK